METTEQALHQEENNRVIMLHAQVERCFREGDDVEGLHMVLAPYLRTGC